MVGDSFVDSDEIRKGVRVAVPKAEGCVSWGVLEARITFYDKTKRGDTLSGDKRAARYPCRGRRSMRTLFPFGMPENTENDRQPDKPVPVNVAIHLAGTSTATARIHARLIQESPVANPKLVEAARKFAEKIKEQEGDEEETIDDVPEAPLLLSPAD